MSDRVVRVLLGVFFFWSASALFIHPFARILAVVVGVGALLEAILGRCPLLYRLGATSQERQMRPEQIRLVTLMGIQVILAYEWFMGGIEKLGGTFTGGIGKTFEKFASENPFVWYKTFLTGYASAHTDLFGWLIPWGELAVGVGLLLSVAGYVYAKTAKAKTVMLVISIAALLGAAFMNANFYFAAGWMSPSTHGLNVVMFWIELILLYGWLSERRAAS